MTTLSGDRPTTGINYYAHSYAEVDLGTAGFAAGSSWSFTVQLTSTTCTDQIGYIVELLRPLPSTEACFRWTGITPAGAPLTLLSYGPSTVGSGIEWTSTSGATGCTDFTRVRFEFFSYSYPGACDATMHWSITYTGTGGTVGVCAYGVEPLIANPFILPVTAAALASVGVYFSNPWTAIPAGILLGTQLASNLICAEPKPVDQVISFEDWTTPDVAPYMTVGNHKQVRNILNLFWDQLCHCKPAPSGSPAPISPPVTVISKPTYYIGPVTNIIDNTEISTTIDEVWNYLTTISFLSNNNISIGQQTLDCSCTNLKLGNAHEGLTGEGVITVSGIHGLSVTYTTLPDRIGVAIGDPDTIYTGAWINVGNAWGWQPRMFPNTTSWIVFPPDMHQMTQVGYSVPEDVVLTIAELVQA